MNLGKGRKWVTIIEIIVWLTIIWVLLVPSIKYVWEWFKDIVWVVKSYEAIKRFQIVTGSFELIKTKHWLHNLDSIRIKDWIWFLSTKEWFWWWIIYIWYFYNWKIVIHRWEEIEDIAFKRDYFLFFESKWKIQQVWKLWNSIDITKIYLQWIWYLNKINQIFINIEWKPEKYFVSL